MSVEDPDPAARPEIGTRTALHMVATHVLARRRHQVTGRFGLRATPGGFGTPAFGDAPEVVRVAGGCLVHEIGGTSARAAIQGATLRQLAQFAGADLDAEFSCGADTPEIDDPDAPITVEPASIGALADWFALGWVVLDEFLSGLLYAAEPATIQLWPEHFDAGTDIALQTGVRMNLGFSPGDGFEAEPYVYVGPWNSERPGDPDFWNAPFGAVLRASDVLADPEPARRCNEFLLAGLHNASGGSHHVT
jgi:hypothetical protein